jgi:hypothetical protein
MLYITCIKLCNCIGLITCMLLSFMSARCAKIQLITSWVLYAVAASMTTVIIQVLPHWFLNFSLKLMAST